MLEDVRLVFSLNSGSKLSYLLALESIVLEKIPGVGFDFFLPNYD